MNSADQKNASRIHTVADAVTLARRRLPAPVFAYIDGAAGTETTMGANREALESVRFRPRMGITVGTEPRELAVDLFGQRLSMPIIVGPVGFTRSMHPDGDAGGLAAAQRANTAFCHSTMSGHSIEQLASPAGDAYWFQLYQLGGRQGAEQLVERARKSIIWIT